MLERLDVRATAIREAAEADILIVVGECDQNYPVQIIRWLEHCLVESSGGPAALVDLHDDVPVQEGAPTTPHSKVAEIAGRWQMNLITNSKFDDWLNDENIHQIVRQPAASLAFSDS